MHGLKNFVGLCQAALYCAMYWGTANFEEVIDLEIRQVLKKGVSIELQIRKGKCNQTHKLQRCIMHPNSRESAGNFLLSRFWKPKSLPG